jgi:outer membrane protein OmpA-like peptidoglycan-associated protein
MLPGSSKSFFNLSDAVEKTGSGKQLTRKRAEGLKAYLVSKGVDSDQITALGWGNLDPIMKGEGANAEVNERVEIGVVTSW